MCDTTVCVPCNREWVSDIPFFHVDDESERRHFISSVALRLEPLAFAPEELIIREGEFTTKM